jgi:hypothetical protein
MWYNGGMEVGDWITLAAVIVALGLGVASILQTQILQKRERRERLLNEIIEWAKESYKLFYDMQNVLYRPKSDKFLWDTESRELEKSLTLIWGQKDAMTITASEIDPKLSELVNLVKNQLDMYWKEKGSWLPDKIKTEENELEFLFAFLFKKTAEIKANMKILKNQTKDTT